MHDEKREILNMLSTGDISVDEAIRLMEALEDGERNEERKSEGRKQQGVHDAVHSIKETLSGVGPLVGRIVGEIGTEFQKDRNFPGENEAEELPPLEHEDNRFPIEEGDRLYIRNDKEEGPGGGDLLIESSEGEFCLFDNSETKNFRLLRSSSGPVIRWSGGRLKVTVPATVAELFAYALGGDLVIRDLDCPVRAKSMGGDLRLVRLKRKFKAKTAGGNIRLVLGPDSLEEGTARTMGGNIRVEVLEGTPRTETEAVTMGGAILVEDEFGETRKGHNFGKQKVSVMLGDNGSGSSLKVKTMGGNIEIRRARDES
ncbi:MAG: DUF2089 domain-containing protein [bacterium]|nr:DUF2089 domain-containing protein [bacterium]